MASSHPRRRSSPCPQHDRRRNRTGLGDSARPQGRKARRCEPGMAPADVPGSRSAGWGRPCAARCLAQRNESLHQPFTHAKTSLREESALKRRMRESSQTIRSLAGCVRNSRFHAEIRQAACQGVPRKLHRGDASIPAFACPRVHMTHDSPGSRHRKPIWPSPASSWQRSPTTRYMGLPLPELALDVYTPGDPDRGLHRSPSSCGCPLLSSWRNRAP